MAKTITRKRQAANEKEKSRRQNTTEIVKR